MRSHPTLSERLASQADLLGILQAFPNSIFTELAGLSGYDFLFLDCEHGTFAEADVIHALQVAASVSLPVMVRVRGHDPMDIGRVMDFGAQGVIVPNVETAAQAKALAAAMIYPPAGTRGFAAPSHRASAYGLDLPAHRDAPRADVLLVVIIESMRGVENSDDILAVDGVDAVFIGPSDLSAALGGVGNFEASAYTTALQRVEHAARIHGKTVGMPPHPGQTIDVLRARGHRLFILGSDTALIRQSMSEQLARARG